MLELLAIFAVVDGKIHNSIISEEPDLRLDAVWQVVDVGEK